jgi:hypothetical protein
MNYADLLVSLGRKPEDMGTAIQTKIKQYSRLQKGIEKNLSLVETSGPIKKKRLQQEIADGEVVLADLNDDLCTAIQKYHDNFATNKRKGNQPKRKGEPVPVSELIIPPVDPEPEPVQEPAPEPIIPAVDPEPEPWPEPVPEPIPEPEKKKNSFAWFGGVLLAAVAVITGISIYESRKN